MITEQIMMQINKTMMFVLRCGCLDTSTIQTDGIINKAFKVNNYGVCGFCIHQILKILYLKLKSKVALDLSFQVIKFK